ncbi:MAG TPA: NAD-dependent dihydropyrimidine dehydrogenase subunit PreA [Methanospirillum sp.]|uniref:NAD-dependent dihydropyrimidine dehydrogenase subunit PreA n=1 Tax=Methanospirillum sp. TaxID=45200 RepID=UPI002CEF9C50|nr:NAD-dependent dihydropyrimidine dehydrogenase subunit PreA [Methanospirillum sp.]HWQ64876.1 NAD-dependent dihydropyrimidine dehydrogenase subunit PreA [Methanospirillum sp.]
MTSILKTTLGSLTLPNPFILASGPPTASGEMIRRAFQAGWGGAVIKTIHPDGMEIQDLSPRFAAWTGTKGELLGFENVELLSKKTVSYWEKEIRSLKQDFPDNLLIASIMGDTDFTTWQDLAVRAGDAGCDAIELNVSCPHGMPEAGVGAAIGQNPDMVRDLTKMVSAVTGVPVFVKLTPNITDISKAALAAEEGGADGISAINTVQCILGVDIQTFAPLPSTGGNGTAGGYSGPAIKPIGLKMVADISRTVSLPIMGIGGISRWQDAAQYILLGASAVQICTAVMWNGYGIIRTMNKGMENYLVQNGFDSPDEIRGAVLGRMQPHHVISRTIRVEPVVSKSEVCLQCGRCVTACRDGGYDALIMTPKGLVVERARCDGCGLCLLVCSSKALTSVIRSG